MVGLIGAGNMARALARGWREPMLCSDSGSGRARELVAEVGGEALASNAEVAERAELVFLCHKPAQLATVAAEVAPRARAVVSILGMTPLAAVSDAYPGLPVVRALPNTPVEVRRGVTCLSAAGGTDPAVVQTARERFARVGKVVEMPDSQVDLAMLVMSNAPAYVALVVESVVDAAIQHGLAGRGAAELFVETLAGTADLLVARGYDTLAVRHEVTSPGGSTARGLAALESGGLRAAFSGALAAAAGQAAR